MKRKYIYICSFFIVIAVFTLVFGLSYQKAKYKHEEIKKVDTISSIRTNSDTKYVLETYCLGRDKVDSKEDTIPAEMAGMNREQLTTYLDNFTLKPPLEESLRGLISFEIISFSSQKLVVRKTYQDMEKNNRFYVTFDKDEVVVYYNDKTSVFQRTGIMSSTLTGDEIAKLRIGFYVKSEDELFSMLENYSS